VPVRRARLVPNTKANVWVLQRLPEVNFGSNILPLLRGLKWLFTRTGKLLTAQAEIFGATYD
jgi:hypothetical protein